MGEYRMPTTCCMHQIGRAMRTNRTEIRRRIHIIIKWIECVRFIFPRSIQFLFQCTFGSICRQSECALCCGYVSQYSIQFIHAFDSVQWAIANDELNWSECNIMFLGVEWYGNIPIASDANRLSATPYLNIQKWNAANAFRYCTLLLAHVSFNRSRTLLAPSANQILRCVAFGAIVNER